MPAAAAEAEAEASQALAAAADLLYMRQIQGYKITSVGQMAFKILLCSRLEKAMVQVSHSI